MRRTRPHILLGRLAAALLVVIAAGALAGITAGRSTGGSAAAAYYEYCPTASASAASYEYCPPPNKPPDCSSVTASPATFWSPNHDLRLVTLTGATDPDGDPVALAITGVTQDEPLTGTGAGDTAPDALPGPTPSSVRLRAERAGGGNGRVYRIAFTVTDGSGGTCSGVATVSVPRDQTKPAIDSRPPSFNSFGP
jgi:hypothetical protein